MLRGCGTRQRGGIYAVCQLAQNGLPPEYFLIDPPLPWREDPRTIINKPTLLPRVVNSKTNLNDLVIWVGAEHYRWAPLFFEEVRHLGVSRRISPLLDLSRLTPGVSRMLMVHPKAYLENWSELTYPSSCPKHILGHYQGGPLLSGPVADKIKQQTFRIVTVDDLLSVGPEALVGPSRTAQVGPCWEKLYQFIGADEGKLALNGTDWYDYTLPSGVTFPYWPNTLEAEFATLNPGLFAAFPITGFEVIGDPSQLPDQEMGKLLTKSVSRAASAGFDVTIVPS